AVAVVCPDRACAVGCRDRACAVVSMDRARSAADNGAVAERGFILTPTYRIHRGRPVVHLHAVLESGEPALVIDDRLVPYFFVAAPDAEPVVRAQVGPPAPRT